MNLSPNYHLGHVLMEGMKKNPNNLCQIDAATGDHINFAEALSKSIKLAKRMRSLNLKPGDVMAFSGKNHIDINIPFYAALFNGYQVSAVDPQFKYDEIKAFSKIIKPSIMFCQPESLKDYEMVVNDLTLDTKIVTYGGDNSTLTSFMQDVVDSELEKDFKVAECDIEKYYACLVSTSGTTGNIKAAAITHQNIVLKVWGFLKQFDSMEQEKQNEDEKRLNLSPVSWISSYINTIASACGNNCSLMTSCDDDVDHIIEAIKKYRPIFTTLGPAAISQIMSKDVADLSSFKAIALAGSKCGPELFNKLQSRLRSGAVVFNYYGMTETIGPILNPGIKPAGSCGRPSRFYKIKLVDPETHIEIKDPYVTGELWCRKGITFSEYYNNPEETAKCITSDGYIKSGDLLYRDEEDNYFYVDRIKALIKYRNYQIIPSEIEDVIHTCSAVKSVCVVGLDDEIDGQTPAACVVLHDGAHVTEQEIKDLVASKLSKSKQLRGGVVFLKEMPITSTGKIKTSKVLKIIMESKYVK